MCLCMNFYGQPEKKSWASFIDIFIHFWKLDTFELGGGRDLMGHGKKIQKAKNTR